MAALRRSQTAQSRAFDDLLERLPVRPRALSYRPVGVASRGWNRPLKLVQPR